VFSHSMAVFHELSGPHWAPGTLAEAFERG
jgi:hypothetical protein